MRNCANINLSALSHNLQRVRQLVNNASVIAVIKANAYGHGMPETAEALKDADAFAVATLEEAQWLRQSVTDKNILLLQGVNQKSDLHLVFDLGLDLVVHTEAQIALLESTATEGNLNVWLKIDTGMHRLGVNPENVAEFYSRLQQSKAVNQIRFMSHFSNADDVADTKTADQLELFLQTTSAISAEKSIANSAGICGVTNSHLDWVRPGIMLYGVNPFKQGIGADLDLQPVMTFRSSLLCVQHFKAGDAIGYGSTWTCPEDMPVGVVSVGYGDGYPRHARSGTPVLINDHKAPLLGRVSMDMISIDLRGITAVAGDEVVLWGDGLPVEEVAESADTIAYELLCKLTRRVQFEYR